MKKWDERKWIPFPCLDTCSDFLELSNLNLVQTGMLAQILIQLNGKEKGVVRFRTWRGCNLKKQAEGLTSAVVMTENGKSNAVDMQWLCSSSAVVTLSKSLLFNEVIPHNTIQDNRKQENPTCTSTSRGTCTSKTKEPGSCIIDHEPEDGSLDSEQEPSPLVTELEIGELMWLGTIIRRWNMVLTINSNKELVAEYVQEKIKSGTERDTIESQIDRCQKFIERNNWIKKRDLGYWCKDGFLDKTEVELKEHFKIRNGGKNKPGLKPLLPGYENKLENVNQFKNVVEVKNDLQ